MTKAKRSPPMTREQIAGIIKGISESPPDETPEERLARHERVIRDFVPRERQAAVLRLLRANSEEGKGGSPLLLAQLIQALAG